LAGDRKTGQQGATGRVGFVVSRSVGGAVVRNQVTRRLRHLMGEHLVPLSDYDLVVRALPKSGSKSSSELAEDLDQALTQAMRRCSK
jgi:ribonuclease P protein component